MYAASRYNMFIVLARNSYGVSNMADNPNFGGEWTNEKLERLRKYLEAYQTIFHNNSNARKLSTTYVDAFAGSGKRIEPTSGVKSSQPSTFDLFSADDQADAREFQKGSVEVALSLTKPFHFYRFIENNPDHVQELNQFIDKQFQSMRDRITITLGDANAEIEQWCNQTDWRKHRAVVFLDPYGMQVKWRTIEVVAQTTGIDMWLLFPLGQAVNRLLTTKDKPPQKWAQRMTDLFGTDAWEAAFYTQSPQLALFEDTSTPEKTATFQSIEKFFVERLESVFVEVAKPRALYNSRNNPLFLLCFAASNPKGASTAIKIAEYILQH